MVQGLPLSNGSSPTQRVKEGGGRHTGADQLGRVAWALSQPWISCLFPLGLVFPSLKWRQLSLIALLLDYEMGKTTDMSILCN